MSDSLEYFRGRMDMLKEQFDGHVRETSDRFIRIENALKEGFRDSQADREAGNKALGDMIQALAERVQTQQETLSRARGALGLSGRAIDIIVMLCGGCLGGVVMHFLVH